MPRRKGGRLVYLSVLQHILSRESRSEVNIATITCLSIPIGALNNYAQIMANCCHKTPLHSSTIYIYGIILESPVDQNPPTACLCRRHAVGGKKTREKHANATQKGLGQLLDSNPGLQQQQ